MSKTAIALCWSLLASLAVLAAGCEKRPKTAASSTQSSAAPGKPAPHYAGKPVTVELFVMSQCPFGVKAEDAIFPVLDQLGNAVEFKLGFIGDTPSPGVLESMHGEAEVQGDMVQACAAKVAPAGYRKLVSCMNRNMKAIPGNWEGCAAEAGLDAAAIRACKDGGEGKGLLAAAFAEAASRGYTGSPTIVVGGKRYGGGRTSEDLRRGICRAFAGQEPPEACRDVPPPAKVALKVVTDRRCKECGAEMVVEQLGGLFPGLEAQVLDYADEAGKKLMAEANVKTLPVFLFDKSVESEAAAYGQVSRFLDPAGPYRALRTGATWDPAAEICDNGADDTGDGKVDCADATCAAKVVCREEQAKRLDVFVMSQCPFGVMALDASKEVLENFKGTGLELGVHYLVSPMPDGSFRSLHGQPELDEDLRQICAVQHYPKGHKFMDYIWCRDAAWQTAKQTKAAEADWKTCTGANGIDAKVIETCATGPEGKALLTADAELSKALGVQGSPTWLVNNRHLAEGADAESIKAALCAHNALPGCDKKLTGMAGRAGGGAPAPAGSCGQ